MTPVETLLQTLPDGHLAATAIAAAKAAGRKILEIYQTEEPDITTKPDNTPVTQADMASNDIITNILAETGIPILSEESAHEDYALRRRHRQMWVVDPLDGTKWFIKHTGEFAVNIALVEDERPTMGVIYIPVSGTLYFATAGGAWRQLADDEQPQRLPICTNPPHIVLVSSAKEQTEIFLQNLRGPWPDARLENVGCSIKQCRIAEGTAAVYPRFGDTMEWDTAAGQAIIEAVGGHLLRMPEATPLNYNRQDLQNPNFLCIAAGIDPKTVCRAMQQTAP